MSALFGLICVVIICDHITASKTYQPPQKDIMDPTNPKSSFYNPFA